MRQYAEMFTGLRQTQVSIRPAAHNVRVSLVLPVVLPETDRTYFKSRRFSILGMAENRVALASALKRSRNPDAHVALETARGDPEVAREWNPFFGRLGNAGSYPEQYAQLLPLIIRG